VYHIIPVLEYFVTGEPDSGVRSRLIPAGIKGLAVALWEYRKPEMETYPEAGVGLCGLSDAHLSYANPCVPRLLSWDKSTVGKEGDLAQSITVRSRLSAVINQSDSKLELHFSFLFLPANNLVLESPDVRETDCYPILYS